MMNDEEKIVFEKAKSALIKLGIYSDEKVKGDKSKISSTELVDSLDSAFIGMHSIFSEARVPHSIPNRNTRVMCMKYRHDLTNAYIGNINEIRNIVSEAFPAFEQYGIIDKNELTFKMMEEVYVIALAFLPGIFSIFYGDEVGLQGIGNLANRAPYPWNHKDKDLLKFFRRIGKIRKKEQFMRKAEIKILKIDHQQFVFERYDESHKILVMVSRTHKETRVELPEEYKKAEMIFNLKGCNTEKLSPYGAIVLKK